MPTADWSVSFRSHEVTDRLWPPPPRPTAPQRPSALRANLSLFPSELFKEIFFQRRLCLYGCLGNAIFVFLLRFHSHTEIFFFLCQK